MQTAIQQRAAAQVHRETLAYHVREFAELRRNGTPPQGQALFNLMRDVAAHVVLPSEATLMLMEFNGSK